MTAKRLDIDTDDLINRYHAGESVNKLAFAFSVSRPAIHRRLLERGIKVRSQSESERMKWAVMTPEQRGAQVAAAHAATVGRFVSADERARRAATRQVRVRSVHLYESAISAILSDAFAKVVPQFAVAQYNIDLAVLGRNVTPVAVEVLGTNPSGNRRAPFLDRVVDVVNRGWPVVLVPMWYSGITVDDIAKDLIARVKIARRHQPSGRHYWVARRNAQEVAHLCAKFHDRPIVEGPGPRDELPPDLLPR